MSLPNLDETALRKPEFAGGVPVVLDDGQTWYFPWARVVRSRRTVAIDPDGRGTTVAIPMVAIGGDGDEFDPTLCDITERFAIANRVGTQQDCLAEMAVNLLSRNYNLAPGDWSRLFSFDDHDAKGLYGPYWPTILGVATGQAPKPTPVG